MKKRTGEDRRVSKDVPLDDKEILKARKGAFEWIKMLLTHWTLPKFVIMSLMGVLGVGTATNEQIKGYFIPQGEVVAEGPIDITLQSMKIAIDAHTERLNLMEDQIQQVERRRTEKTNQADQRLQSEIDTINRKITHWHGS